MRNAEMEIKEEKFLKLKRKSDKLHKRLFISSGMSIQGLKQRSLSKLKLLYKKSLILMLTPPFQLGKINLQQIKKTGLQKQDLIISQVKQQPT
jgi:hypothetical protein